MTKILWMSDPHFQNAGTIAGLNPRTRLDAAIAFCNAHYADADLAVLSGDLVGDDIEGDYSAMAGYLAESKVKIHPMMGNNDDRDGMLRHLEVPKDRLPGFIQYAIEVPEGLIVCLDTHKVGSHAGQLCEARLDWLDGVLGSAGERPVFIFMHHPPLALGLPKQDEIMLEDGGAFLDMIARHGNVRHLFMGHVHRPTSGTVRGIPFATIGALSFQAPAPRPAWDWDSFVPATEPPHFAVIDLNGGDVTLQLVQFCRYELGMDDS